MQKRTSKYTLIFASITLLSLGACNHSTTPEKEEIKNAEYELKDGYSESDIFGSPYINSNLEGMLNKIKKPSLKEDFYSSINYDELTSQYEKGRPYEYQQSIYTGDTVVANRIKDILAGESEYTAKPILTSLYSLSSEGVNLTIKDFFDNLDPDTYITSKESLYTLNPIVTVTNKDNGRYILSVMGGYESTIIGSNYITYIGSMYRNPTYVEKAKQISDIVLEHIGYEENERNEIVEEAYNLEASLITAYFKGQQRYFTSTVNDLDMTYPLKDVLKDGGLNDEDRILYTGLDKAYLEEYQTFTTEQKRTLIINRIAYDLRYLCGIETAKKVSEIASTYYGLENYELNISSDSKTKAMREISKYYSSYLLQKTYKDLYISRETKEETINLIGQVVDEYKLLLQNNRWLSKETKAKAIEKVNAMDFDACYPDELESSPYPEIINYNDLYTWYLNNNKYLFDLVKSNNVISNQCWSVPIYTVNGAYFPTLNGFCIYQGLIDCGVLGNSIEEKLGMLGTIVGHEISHAFDSTGSNYDKNGNRVNWWTTEDKKAFNDKVVKLVNFFYQIQVTENKHVNGNYVKGEATADMGGMKVVLSIAKKNTNFNYKTFFEAYAKMWSVLLSREKVEEYVGDGTSANPGNEHPLPYVRVNTTLSQFDEFNNTYGIKSGDAMYIPKSLRVAIW